MTEQAPSIRWEGILDRELADLANERAGPRQETEAEALPQSGTAGEGRVLTVEQLRTKLYQSVKDGLTFRDDIYDESGALLLCAGSQINRQFVQSLRDRGIARVWLRSCEAAGETSPAKQPKDAGAAPLQSPHARELDEQLVRELDKPIALQSVKAWRRPRLPVDDLKGEAARGVSKHAAARDAVASISESLAAGCTMSAAEIRRSVANFVEMAATDFDLLPLIVAMQQSQDEYLYDHCTNVAMISMAIAAHLQLDRDSITQIGLGGLLHDIGMLRVPESIRLAARKLDDREWLEIQRHPLHSLDMLANLRGLPQVVRMIVYQAHERTNGSGYPRARLGRQIHQYAEIVAVADAFAAMTGDRPYRPALTPYDASTTILREGAADEFDRFFVRALLDTISLFPIGSRVTLSDGSNARVLRANPGLHTRPIVEALAADGAATGRIVDLSADESLRVIAVPATEGRAMPE